jgi:hypothetical protein
MPLPYAKPFANELSLSLLEHGVKYAANVMCQRGKVNLRSDLGLPPKDSSTDEVVLWVYPLRIILLTAAHAKLRLYYSIQYYFFCTRRRFLVGA